MGRRRLRRTPGHRRQRPAAADPDLARPRSANIPGLLTRALHICTLSAFAVAQPALDLLGRHGTFFVAHDSRPLDLVAFAFALCVLLPATLFLVELVPAMVSRRAGRSLHTVLVTFLAGAILLQILRRAGEVSSWIWLPGSLLLGIVAAELYDRFAVLRTYLTWLSPAPLIFAGGFLFFTPVKGLVFPALFSPTVDTLVSAEIPVVMVVFDELSLPTLMDSSHRIDAGRYPRFAELSRRAHWFRNATTSSELTTVAVPTLLTGRYRGEDPGNLLLATDGKYPNNLFTLLAPEYRLHVVENTTRLCPRALCGDAPFAGEPGRRLALLLQDVAIVYGHSVLPADLADRLPAIGSQWRDFGNLWRFYGQPGEVEASRPPQIFADFVAALGSNDHRTLHFLHCALPHMPWRYLPSGKNYGAPGTGFLVDHGLGDENWDANETSTLQAFQRYLLQLRYTDRLLGDLIDALDARGLWDPALIVITADHGVSFHPGQPRRLVRDATSQDLLPVPLFIKLPRQRQGTVSDRNVEIVDVLPTVADALGLTAPPWPMDGTSLLDPNTPERGEKVLYLPPYDPSSFITYPARFDVKYAAVDRMLRIFGAGSDPLALYRLGPHPELVGQPLKAVDVAPEPEGEVRLERPELYDDVDLDAPFLPARLLGEIRHPRERGDLALAVAVGGTVATVIRTLSHDGDSASFAAMLPESAFSPGYNKVEVFVVSSRAGRARLTPTAVAPR